MMTRSAFIIVLALAACSCNNNKTGDQTPPAGKNTDTVTVVLSKEEQLLRLSDSVKLAFSKTDYEALARFADPVLGVRFSPYGYIDTVHAIVLSKQQLSDLQTGSQQKLIWGTYDGSGDTIRLTPGEYFKKFVYDADFLHPETQKVNAFIGHGNSLNNLKAVYPAADFTESHFSGFDKKYEGMDWRSLRLVFRKADEKYYLIAVIHDQWTS